MRCESREDRCLICALTSVRSPIIANALPRPELPQANLEPVKDQPPPWQNQLFQPSLEMDCLVASTASHEPVPDLLQPSYFPLDATTRDQAPIINKKVN